MLDMRRARIDVPPRPTNNDEVPSKEFGNVEYPTEDELLKRQEGQIHLNDDPAVSYNTPSV